MAKSRFWGRLRILRVALAAFFLAVTTLAFGYAADLAALVVSWLGGDASAAADATVALTRVTHANLAPAILSAAARLSLFGVVAAAVILTATAFLGRAYCSVVCPFGVLQDLLGLLRVWERKSPPQPRLLRLRKGLGATVWAVALIGGWALGLRFLDPYTLFGAIAAGGVLPLLFVAVLVAWRTRFFCNSLCPVGALLACVSAHAPLGLTFTSRCVKCGKCATVCPTGCLDPKAGTIDNGRCVRCLKCAAVCPLGAIAYGRNPGFRLPTRREALTVGGLLAGGAAAGVAARLVGPKAASDALLAQGAVCPPGAGDLPRFFAACTDCRLCVANCPTHAIKPAGPLGVIHLDYADGARCDFDCKRCTEVCPTGALLPLTLAVKRRTRLGLARHAPDRCRAYAGEDCGRCTQACPVGAVRLERIERDGETFLVPKVYADRCVGCGACQAVCPAPGKAIVVEPLPDGAQTLLPLPPPAPESAYQAIYPPGAGSPQRFLAKCTDCGRCVATCEGRVLRSEGRPGSVHLVFDAGMCEYYCTKCGEVCPTGAISLLDLAVKQRTRIGLAELEPSICVAFSTENACGACAEHCPTGALRMKPDAEGLLVPTLTTDLCIGCGSCEYPCPVRPVKAIRVRPLPDGVQVLAADPNVFFAPTEPAPAPATDDWLI